MIIIELQTQKNKNVLVANEDEWGSPWGAILITRGPDAWNYKNFSSGGLGVGWLGASAMAVGYKYYYIGDINNFKMNVFEGWGL